jgi:hypothetical protein
MSDMNTLLTSIRDGIAGNAAIKTWTQATYTKDHKVFVGLDTRFPPAESDCPCVVLSPARKIGGESQEVITHKFEVSCEIINEGSTTTSNKVEYNGVQEIETFRQKVLDAIHGLADIRIRTVETEYETIMFFPSFMCDMVITIEEETEFGSEFVE